MAEVKRTCSGAHSVLSYNQITGFGLLVLAFSASRWLVSDMRKRALNALNTGSVALESSSSKVSVRALRSVCTPSLPTASAQWLVLVRRVRILLKLSATSSPLARLLMANQSRSAASLWRAVMTNGRCNLWIRSEERRVGKEC